MVKRYKKINDLITKDYGFIYHKNGSFTMDNLTKKFTNSLIRK